MGCNIFAKSSPSRLSNSDDIRLASVKPCSMHNSWGEEVENSSSEGSVTCILEPPNKTTPKLPSEPLESKLLLETWTLRTSAFQKLGISSASELLPLQNSRIPHQDEGDTVSDIPCEPLEPLRTSSTWTWNRMPLIGGWFRFLQNLYLAESPCYKNCWNAVGRSCPSFWEKSLKRWKKKALLEDLQGSNPGNHNLVKYSLWSKGLEGSKTSQPTHTSGQTRSWQKSNNGFGFQKSEGFRARVSIWNEGFPLPKPRKTRRVCKLKEDNAKPFPVPWNVPIPPKKTHEIAERCFLWENKPLPQRGVAGPVVKSSAP